MSAESHYLNALEALDEGDRDRAKAEARKATSLDPEHLEAGRSTLKRASSGPNATDVGQAAKRSLR